MNEKKRVVVVIANYNNKEYLIQSVKSAINQTYKPTAICVVDDCSTDGSFETLLDFVQDREEIDGVKIFIQKLDKNSGPSVARNYAISRVLNNCDFIAILDSDDEMISNKIEVFVNKFNSMPNSLGIIYGDYYIHNIKTGLTKIEFKHSYSFEKLTKSCIIHSGSVIRSECFRKVGLYDERLKHAEDYDLWLRIAKHYVAYRIPEPLTFVRITGKNISDPENEVYKQNAGYAFSIIREKLAAKNNGQIQ